MVASSALPFWVEPPPSEPGSIDPLGYLAQSERIADQLLPGVTVLTVRARYLSFLCWAIQETGNDPKLIDRWEVAFSIGEHWRHGNSDAEPCRFLGNRLLVQRQLEDQDALPRRLHVQTARLLYSGLLRSCGFLEPTGKLSRAGVRIAESFGKRMPRSLPSKVRRCSDMPCLSEITERERQYLSDGLLGEDSAAKLRADTFGEVGKLVWRQIRRRRAAWLLAMYIGRPHREDPLPIFHLRQAALLELQALPLTRLFLFLYQNRGAISGKLQAGQFRAYKVREDGPQLLADLTAHLKQAHRLGAEIPELKLADLKTWLLNRHRQEAKPEAPWVDEAWRVLRPGLQPRQLPGVHLYRLEAFASLLTDLREI